MRNSKGQFVKGTESWLKGTKGLVSNPLKGLLMPEDWKIKLRKPKSSVVPFTEERRKKISDAQKKRIGPLNNHWKGGKSVKRSKVRRERLAINGGCHTNGEWELLKDQYNFTCPSCQTYGIALTKDHIIPVSKGGSDNISNIQPLCMKCNVHKHTKVIKY